MTKQKQPKITTKEELRAWVRSVGRENIDAKTLKKAHKQIKQDKKRKTPTMARGRLSYDKTKVFNKRSSK